MTEKREAEEWLAQAKNARPNVHDYLIGEAVQRGVEKEKLFAHLRTVAENHGPRVARELAMKHLGFVPKPSK